MESIAQQVSETPGQILVVDDDLIGRRLLQRMLESDGFDVVAVESGEMALNVLHHGRGKRFDVVVLDIVMPGIDGYATLAAIKEEEETAHVPVIMITGIDDLASVVRCIELGATDYLSKPFNPTLLRARINASLAGKRLRDLERDYLEQVGLVTAAASALEAGIYEADALMGVADRSDALGQLARVFRQMVDEVRVREESLRAEVRELRIEIDAQRQADKVAEITETDFYRELRKQAESLRKIIDT